MAVATIILDNGGGRPQPPKQKTFRLRQNGEWRHPQIPPENGSGTGLILLLDGEVGPAPAGPRRAQTNRYPDFGLPTSLPPSRSRKRETSGRGSL